MNNVVRSLTLALAVALSSGCSLLAPPTNGVAIGPVPPGYSVYWYSQSSQDWEIRKLKPDGGFDVSAKVSTYGGAFGNSSICERQETNNSLLQLVCWNSKGKHIYNLPEKVFIDNIDFDGASYVISAPDDVNSQGGYYFSESAMSDAAFNPVANRWLHSNLIDAPQNIKKLTSLDNSCAHVRDNWAGFDWHTMYFTTNRGIGKPVVIPLAENEAPYSVAISADDQFATFVTGSGKTQSQGLYIADLNTGRLTRIPFVETSGQSLTIVRNGSVMDKLITERCRDANEIEK